MKKFNILFLTCIMLKTFAITCYDLKQGSNIKIRGILSGTPYNGFVIIDEIISEGALTFKITILLGDLQTKSISANCNPQDNNIRFNAASGTGYISLTAGDKDVNFTSSDSFFQESKRIHK